MTHRAAIDIGTNSVRLLVAETRGVAPVALASELRITRLGEGLDATGSISGEAERRTLEAVAGFANVARSFGAAPFIYGTAALREARNGPDVAGRISKACGIPVRILSGREEALLTLRGVALGHTVDESTMVLDIGGGSTEFTVPRGNDDASAHSLPLGSVRQSERHIRHYPPLHSEIDALTKDVRDLVARGTADARRLACRRIIGVAGSVTQIVALELQLDPYDPAKVNGYLLETAAVEKWIAFFAAHSLDEIRALRGMVAKRAETILAGTMILLETLRALNAPAVIVSEYDSLWGGVILTVSRATFAKL